MAEEAEGAHWEYQVSSTSSFPDEDACSLLSLTQSLPQTKIPAPLASATPFSERISQHRAQFENFCFCQRICASKEIIQILSSKSQPGGSCATCDLEPLYLGIDPQAKSVTHKEILFHQKTIV